ncbi:MAG: AMP-binding protein [Candidatus Protistobacter heckmanni]|nr:AMP-binding protein [Candidatus Protistobacter heckmanni]
MILKHGGTMYVDGGDPGAQGLDRTLESLSEVRPTVYFNLPLGYAALLPHLRRDPCLHETFFSRLQVLFSAGAPMPAETAAALRDMAEGCKCDPVQILSAWGGRRSRRWRPTATSRNTPRARSACAVARTELKLVEASDGRREIRMRGACTSPGYWRSPEMGRQMFDEEGYYRSGDAGELVDSERSERGLAFRGRMVENFRLTNGAWVHVETLRNLGVEVFGTLASQIVVSGRNQEQVGLLVFPNMQACIRLSGLPADTPRELVLRTAWCTTGCARAWTGWCR